MIYKFKSQADGDLIMLEPQGRRVLEILGKDAGAHDCSKPARREAAGNFRETGIGAGWH